MKKWFFLLAALLLGAVAGGVPFSGTDAAELQPVELLYLNRTGGMLEISTDTGDSGRGADLAAAFRDLKAGAAGKIFLETADTLLLSPSCEDLLNELPEYLRPACGVCLGVGDISKTDLWEINEYLSAHEPGVTLLDLRAGETRIPILRFKLGEMRLVE